MNHIILYDSFNGIIQNYIIIMINYYAYIRVRPDEKETQIKYYKKILKSLENKQTGNIQIRMDIAHYNEPWPMLNQLIDKELNPGDILYVPEVRQISRSIQSFLGINEVLNEKKIILIILELSKPTTDNHVDLSSTYKVSKKLQKIFSKLYKLEKDQRLRRQKRAINIAKEEGKVIGRPSYLSKNENIIKKVSLLRKKGTKVPQIADKVGLSIATVYRILKSY